MNYNYESINNVKNPRFPYGVKEIITFSRSELAHVDISAQNIGDKKNPKARVRIYIRLRTDSYFYAWFENNEQAVEAMKAIYNNTSSRVAVINANGNDKDDYRIRRDYIVDTGSELYYEALRNLSI
jgi:hypothetical protein